MLCFISHQQEVSQRIDGRYFQIWDDLLILGLVLLRICVSTGQSSQPSGDSSFPVQRGGSVLTYNREGILSVIVGESLANPLLVGIMKYSESLNTVNK